MAVDEEGRGGINVMCEYEPRGTHVAVRGASPRKDEFFWGGD